MALSLYFTSERFKVEGEPWPGIPLFVRDGSMGIEYFPTEWMYSKAVVSGWADAPGTWRSYAYDLLGYLNYSERKGRDWRHYDEESIAHYRQHLSKKKRKVRGQRRLLERNTIAQVLTTICWFYEWMHRRGYSKLPLSYERVQTDRRRKHALLGHIYAGESRKRPIVVPKRVKKRAYKRYFTENEQERFFEVLSPRDRLMVEWALETGAREHEICSLRLSDIPDERFYRDKPFCSVTITGKGGKTRDLYVPKWLIRKTHQYMRLMGRPATARKSRERGRPASDQLFLSERGTGLKPDSIYRNFSKALRSVVLRGTFHDLRHTFAITMLDRLMNRMADPHAKHRNALLALKMLMGHESLSSTEVYLVSWEFYKTDLFQKTWELPEVITSASA